MGPQPAAGGGSGPGGSGSRDSVAGPSKATNNGSNSNGGEGSWLQDLQSLTSMPQGDEMSDEDSDVSIGA